MFQVIFSSSQWETAVLDNRMSASYYFLTIEPNGT